VGGVYRNWTRSENYIIGQERHRENGRKRDVIRLNSGVKVTRKWAGKACSENATRRCTLTIRV